MRPKFSDCSFRKGSGHTHRVTIGSLEGNGQATLGTRTLYVGSNDLSATFSGVIQGEGSVIKIGTGTLTLSGANTYAGPSSVTAGTLVADNVIGSATGTGPVQVEAGTLGGSGTVAGAVTIGTGNGSGSGSGSGSGTGAFLAPAHGGNEQLTLSIEGSLTFNVDATYTYSFKAKRKQAKADKVVANGVTISSSASTNLSGQTQGTLTQGLVLIVICNTAATPISGTFSNLPDGTIATVNGNNFQANYEGGDGNDLTQTIVP